MLERLAFSQQQRLFDGASVLVCVHGQGCANTAFMRRGGVLLLLMPPGWFGWKFMRVMLPLCTATHPTSLLPPPSCSASLPPPHPVFLGVAAGWALQQVK